MSEKLEALGYGHERGRPRPGQTWWAIVVITQDHKLGSDPRISQ